VTTVTPETSVQPTFVHSDLVILGGSAIAVAGAGVAHYSHASGVVCFVLAAVAVTLLASLVGRSVEQLGDRFGPGATGVLQSALGNLPELFIALFALKAGLVDVVQAALVGSILANLLFVLGLSFVVGGLKHGTQRLGSDRARSISVLMVLSIAAMVVPSIAHYVHSPVASHEKAFSTVVACVLLVVFALSLPASLKRGQSALSSEVTPDHEPPRWPVWLSVALLAAAGLLAAFVSDWFVAALTPAMASLHISQVFAGLVIVAIAGNAIENVVGVQLAARNQSEYAFSVVINSPLQIALVLAPLLVILSQVFGIAALTLVFSPLLIVSLVIAVSITIVITFDGESNWIEGASMIAVYVVIAGAFWWG
jgi:Ca2+:H+ antiporter